MLRKLITTAIVANFMFMLVGVLTTSDLRINGTAMAETNTTTFGTVGATVPSLCQISATVLQFDHTEEEFNWTLGTPVSSIDFGTLVPVYNETGGAFCYMGGQYWYGIVLSAATSGRSYHITQTSGVLQNTGGTGTIGAVNSVTEDAYLIVPDYQAQDQVWGVNQGNMPTGASIGYPARAAGATNTIYTSDAAGLSRMVRAYLAIRGAPEVGDLVNYAQGWDVGGIHQGQTQTYNQNSPRQGWNVVGMDQPAGSYNTAVGQGLTFTVTTS